MRTPPVRLVTALGRQIDRQVCAGSIANAAQSVHRDRERADQRRDAWLAFEQVRSEASSYGRRALPRPRRTG